MGFGVVSLSLGTPVFPAADGLEGNTELVGKGFLRHILLAAKAAEIVTDVQFHSIKSFRYDWHSAVSFVFPVITVYRRSAQNAITHPVRIFLILREDGGGFENDLTFVMRCVTIGMNRNDGRISL